MTIPREDVLPEEVMASVHEIHLSFCPKRDNH